MLYETCARAEELLQLNIEDLDLAGRSAPVKSKGAEPRTRRRGATTFGFGGGSAINRPVVSGLSWSRSRG
jgi:integrase